MNFDGKATCKDGTDMAKALIKHKRDIALVEGAAIVEGECIVRCPVDTGHLKGSISRRIRLAGGVDGSDKPGGLQEYPESEGEAHIGTNVSYAAHVEFGTKHQKAQPYMRPGAMAAMPLVERRFAERLGEKITITKVE